MVLSVDPDIQAGVGRIIEIDRRWQAGGQYIPDYPGTTVFKPKPIPSDGGPTDYYKLPPHATELRHLISHLGMSKSRGDIFKACWRLGLKEGTTIEYDLNKMKLFIDDLIEMHKRGEHL